MRARSSHVVIATIFISFASAQQALSQSRRPTYKSLFSNKDEYTFEGCAAYVTETNREMVDNWFSAPIPDASTKVFMIGDSNLEHYSEPVFCGAHCADTIANSVNYGVGGSSCGQIVMFSQTLVNYYPKEDAWYIIHCGQNDIEFYPRCGETYFEQESVQMVIARFKAVVVQLLALENPPRILYPGGALYPETETRTEFLEYDREMEKLALELATGKEVPPLVFIDSQTAIDDLGLTDIYADDGIHFNEKGYQYWNEWIHTALEADGDDADCVVWVNNECTQHAPKASDDQVDNAGAGAFSVFSATLGLAMGLWGLLRQ